MRDRRINGQVGWAREAGLRNVHRGTDGSVIGGGMPMPDGSVARFGTRAQQPAAPAAPSGGVAAAPAASAPAAPGPSGLSRPWGNGGLARWAAMNPGVKVATEKAGSEVGYAAKRGALGVPAAGGGGVSMPGGQAGGLVDGPDTKAATGDLLKRRQDLYGRMASGMDAGRAYEEAKGLGVTERGWSRAVGRLGGVPGAGRGGVAAGGGGGGEAVFGDFSDENYGKLAGQLAGGSAHSVPSAPVAPAAADGPQRPGDVKIPDMPLVTRPKRWAEMDGPELEAVQRGIVESRNEIRRTIGAPEVTGVVGRKSPESQRQEGKWWNDSDDRSNFRGEERRMEEARKRRDAIKAVGNGSEAEIGGEAAASAGAALRDSGPELSAFGRAGKVSRAGLGYAKRAGQAPVEALGRVAARGLDRGVAEVGSATERNKRGMKRVSGWAREFGSGFNS